MWYDGGVTNLYKTQTRSYAPDLGRFTQVDPARAGTNWHAYAGGDPVNRSDPTGLDWEWQSSGVLAAGGEWKYVDGTDPFVPFPQFTPSDVGGVDYVGPKEYRDIRDAYDRGEMQGQSDSLARTDGLASLMVGGAFPTNFANTMGPFTASPYLLGLAANNPEIARSIAPAIIATGSSDPRLFEMGNRAFANAAQQSAHLEDAFGKVDNFYAHQAWRIEQDKKSQENIELGLTLVMFAADGVGGIEAGAIGAVGRELPSLLGMAGRTVLSSTRAPLSSGSDLLAIFRGSPISSVRDFTKVLRDWRIIRNAKSWQGKGDYSGVDDYIAKTLRVGSKLWGGTPGPSPFYTTTSAVEASGNVAETMFGMLQVGRSKVHGTFRPGMTLYTLNQNLRVAIGIVRANPQFGPGRAVQIYIEEYKTMLTPVRIQSLKR